MSLQDVDYISLIRSIQFDKTHRNCDCKFKLKREICPSNRRCEQCYKNHVIRKIYYTMKYTQLNWCDVTFQDFNFDDNYVPIYNVLKFKANKHYLDVKLPDNNHYKYNYFAQNIIAKCIYDYYLYNDHRNISVYGREVYFHHNNNKVIVRIYGFSTKGKSIIRCSILEPSIITFY